jgi:hypothetical protein
MNSDLPGLGSGRLELGVVPLSSAATRLVASGWACQGGYTALVPWLHGSTGSLRLPNTYVTQCQELIRESA